MREICLSASGHEIALVEDGRLAEFYFSEEDSQESVILGRVVRVLSGMQAAFVDIGQERNGFLPLREGNLPPAQLQPGQSVLVQVRKEAHGEKGAFLTRDLAISGSYLILMPMSRMIGVSQKIVSDSHRTRLQHLGETLAQGRFGLVMRTAAQTAPAETLAAEAESLCAVWQSMEKAAHTATAPCSLSSGHSVLETLIRDYSPRGIDRLIGTDAAVLDAYPGPWERVVVENDPIRVGGYDTAMRKALQRRVWLKSGGNLVFDACEAMTVIDVNTAKFTGKRHHAEAALLHTDLEACEEIARQIRLRALGGIIVIDMIDLQTDAERETILETLRAATAKDSAKCVIHGFTRLGLIEMTRKRTRRSLMESVKAHDTMEQEAETAHERYS